MTEEAKMDFLKKLFESGALTWEQFLAACNEKGYKLADLSTGNYVAKKKYEDELAAKDSTIEELNTQISNRDTDITNLQKQLEDGSKDNATKLAEVTSQLSKLQGDYETAKSDYEGKLSAQAYEFAVKEFAGTKNFTSAAARRDFIKEMIASNLTMKDNKILGAEDFVAAYTNENADAFVSEEPDPNPAPSENKPTFVQPTPPQPAPEDNAFISAFNFMGVRPHDNK